MINNITLFNSSEFGEMRTHCDPKSGDVWFCLVDVCKALDINNPRMVKSRLDDDVSLTYAISDSLGREQNATFVNESGLYEVILRSDSPKAKPFRKWVCSEVIPSIRKHGAYMASETIEEAIKNPDIIIKIATELKTEQEARKKLQAEAKENEPKVKFANALMSSESSILISQLASILTQNGYKIGQNRLFEWLRKNDYLHENTENRNLPKQKWIEKGYFEIKTSVYFDNKAMALKTKSTPKITMRGVEHILNIFGNGSTLKN